MKTLQPATQNRPGGMLGFTLVWAGQLVSVLALPMTQAEYVTKLAAQSQTWLGYLAGWWGQTLGPAWSCNTS